MGDRIVLWLLMPRRACYALTSDGFLGFRGPRAAGKHRDGSLASWSHASLNAVRSIGTLSVMSQQACLHLQAPIPSPEAMMCLTATWLAQPPSSSLADTWMRCHASVCGTTAARDQSVVVGCINKLPSLRRETAARFDSACLSCSSSAHLPDGCAASCHRADRSRRTQLSVSNLVTTVFTLACCTRSLAGNLRRPTCPKKAVEVFDCSTLGSSVVLVFPRCRWR